MVTIDSLFYLASDYNLGKDDESLYKAIELASKDFNEVMNKDREYPPFIYYICLEHMDNNPKYKFGKTFRMMSDDEKKSVFDETINALKDILA